ncbi:MAG TPA: S8 family serine peptidase [Sphingomonas sp.]|nr:S8 family serine peptidase [Sphingomonas sp.]
MKRLLAISIPIALLASVAAQAQLLPPLPNVHLPQLPTDMLDQPLERVTTLVDRTARVLDRTRLQRLTAFLHDNRATVAPDDRGFPAVRGEVLLTSPAPDDIARLADDGFAVIDDGTIPGLGLRTVRLATPKGMTLKKALKRARRIAGDRISADNIHFRSGERAAVAVSGVPTPSAAPTATSRAPVGMIDGGVAASPLIPPRVTQHGFAAGAPAPDPHATAMASLLIGEGKVRGADPGAHLFAADVYGRDPAGGGALAIARALGWMIENRVKVVAISLVGPKNALLGRAVALAEDKGLTVVAAVGNDGPAAPPAYPASYPGVLAITGVDADDKVLVEAGRALHLDYAAPGADLLAATPGSRAAPVRGTSFATALAAGRLAALTTADHAEARRALDREAVDLGEKGPDSDYGRGLVCGSCATRP